MVVTTAVSANVPGVVGAMRLSYAVAADTELVAAVAGKQIHVLGWIAYSVGGSTALESATDIIIGAFAVLAAPMVLSPTATVLCSTVAGEALNVELSATNANTGTLWYVVDP